MTGTTGTTTSTTLSTDEPTDGAKRPLPGLLQIWSPDGPVSRHVPWCGDELLLGRETAALGDSRVSRQHCRVTFDGALWVAQDLDSRNGTFLDGVRVHGPVRVDEGQVLRVGHSLFVAQSDLHQREGGVEVHDGVIAGASLREVLRQITERATAGEPLLLVGPTGSGKHLLARRFHELASAGAPLVNGSHQRIIDDSVEAALRKAVRAAGAGTLLIVGVDELGAAAQDLLIDLCEPQSRPRLCVTAREDLRVPLRRNRLRKDLFFRLHASEVKVPSLAHRLEEQAFHIHQELATQRLQALPTLVERCVRMPWPGNVRELRAEVRVAGVAALQEGLSEVAGRHLRAGAGEAEKPSDADPVSISAERLGDPAHVLAALRTAGGNVRATARALKVHRNQLSRWLDQRALDPRALPADDDEPDR